MSHTVTLGWPARELSPNWRGHWSKKAKAAKKYRLDCFYLAKEAGLAVDWDGPIHLHAVFFPPDRRQRDDDNMIASFKSGRDGLADALGIDDKRFTLHAGVSDLVGGKVVVVLSSGVK